MAVEVNLATGLHQILNIPSLSNSKCIEICQLRGQIQSGFHRLLLLSHKDSGE